MTHEDRAWLLELLAADPHWQRERARIERLVRLPRRRANLLDAALERIARQRGHLPAAEQQVRYSDAGII